MIPLRRPRSAGFRRADITTNYQQESVLASRGSTIQDVARRAGVATSTVSKAFNNRTDISEPVRERIMAIAAELHYVPNALIRSLRRGHSNTVGLYTWEVATEHRLAVVHHLFRGLSVGIKDLECDLLTYSHMPKRTPDRMAATFLDGRVDGVVTSAGDIDDQGLRALADAKLPTVVIYRRDVPDGIGCVTIDNAAGVTAAVDHLVDFGHRRIAFWAPMYTPDYAERAAAYRSRTVERGLAFDPDLSRLGSDHQMLVSEACDYWLALDSPPTALVAGDDSVALSFMQELNERGVRVPEDISVVGFDATAQESGIPITSIHQPAYEVGKTAAAFVGAMIKGAPASSCRVSLPVEFVPSGSTGPVAQKRG